MMNQGPLPHSEATDHKLIFDPVPFSGGSKIAVREMLALCNPDNVKFTVLTNNPASWSDKDTKDRLTVMSYSLPELIQTRVGGLGYWFKQLLLLLIICYTHIKLSLRGQKPSAILGISGPGVDLSIYLFKYLFNCKIIQLVQGPVAPSRSIGYCLTRADEVFYLSSSKPSIIAALHTHFNSSLSATTAKEITHFQVSCSRYVAFDNGLNKQRWPTPCEYLETNVFWAASLLKWKGLDILLEASRIVRENVKLQYQICYIKPESTNAEVSLTPIDEEGFHWFEKPGNLDEIRSRCSIFVSTSKNEPFGLSILESLAAGLCVVIPADNAYWDQKLVNSENCIKYQPENPSSLADALCQLAFNPRTIERVGQSGRKIAQRYEASISYRHIVESLEETTSEVISPVNRSSV
ncbi:glycosyltransferase family 4 protein [Vibrio sp. HN007]|uniref:glycosyltransferase family 4 protein n=1 Tax=Vibrio iocasae TaxID=3098914 RepID=UPI0035D46AC7